MKKEKTGMNLPKMIILGVVVAILGVGGGALGSYLTSDQAMAFMQPSEEEEITYIKVPYSEFLINLKPMAYNDKSFLRMAFTFAVIDEENETILLEEEAKVRDTIIALLRKKTSESIFTEDDSNLAIKQEVKEQVNQLLGETIVEEVFVTDMVMQ